MAEEYYEEPETEGQQGGLPAWLTETPYWAISAVLHIVLLLIIGSVVVMSSQKDENTTKQLLVRQEYKPKDYDWRKKRDMVRRPEILNPQKKNPILKLKPDKITPTIPKGKDMKNLTNKDLLSNSINDAFGIGGGAAGAYGNRFGKGSLSREGGSEGTEEAVLAALMWLMRHQAPDGHWSSKDFIKQCKDPNHPCTNKEKAYTDGRGFDGFDVGVTGLAMLAYLGYGHTHKQGERREFREVMAKAMNWMLKQQVHNEDPMKDGVFGKNDNEQWVYNHAVATMAMGELLLLSRDVFKLKKPVDNAIQYIMRAQNEGAGWRYNYRDGNDSSVTGWMVLALKTGKACSELRLLNTKKDDYEKHLDGALAWYDAMAGHATKRCGYMAPGDEGSMLLNTYPEPYPFSKDLSCMTAVSVLCRLFSGQRRSSDIIKQQIAILMRHPPNWKPARGTKSKSEINMYYWYYATYAMFQYGGISWKEWNKNMQEALLPTQRVGGCEDGSWDPIGEWGAAGGRVYSTAIGAMTLEVYYRYTRTKE